MYTPRQNPTLYLCYPTQFQMGDIVLFVQKGTLAPYMVVILNILSNNVHVAFCFQYDRLQVQIKKLFTQEKERPMENMLSQPTWMALITTVLAIKCHQ